MHMYPEEISELQNDRIHWQLRAAAAEKKLQALEFVVSYARDIVKSWDTVSFRTLRSLNTKIQGLKEALEMLK